MLPDDNPDPDFIMSIMAQKKTTSHNPILTLDLETLSSKNKIKKTLFPLKQTMGALSVRIIPEREQTPKWVPGELIGFHITKRELQIIHNSEFGPLKSVIAFPTIQSSILMFRKRYDPERLARILKVNYGIEAEPNGIIEAQA